ncbi:MAG TPA: S46 family peptidase [Bacteroidales bacterium]|nr:S46 family peptidase [Bacteroidales bacterium]HPT12809.1 S46 family peptidase [Bacteroidales bacterium]
MKRNSILLTALLMVAAAPVLRADEGMWIPMLIEKYNINLMQEKGFKLSAEDIYSINKASMKDAVVIFGGGCTGEFISDKGLLITNHHCGYSNIVNHSTLEHDYLTNGFWAMSQEEELSNPGLTITILKYMEDVTLRVQEGIKENMTEDEKSELIRKNTDAICKKAVEGTHYLAQVKPFYMGNQYFLFVEEVFKDVRLVGAPPSAIGKFGGETDNWVWPRHTGDFSLFRVYANAENKPADYSKDNVPYKPAYHFPVSIKGVKEGDFTMVFGYPGSTREYAPSSYIRMIKDVINPNLIAIRDAKISIMEKAMATDPLIRLQYSSKKSGLANSWKKWIGEKQGLEKMDAVGKKEAYEAEFQKWASSEPVRNEKYGKILEEYNSIYERYKEYYLVNSFTNEVFISGPASLSLASSLSRLPAMLQKNDQNLPNELNRLKNTVKSFQKSVNIPADKKIFVAVLQLYHDKIDPKWQAESFKALYAEYNGNLVKMAEKLYSTSILFDSVKVSRLLGNFNKHAVARLSRDPLFQLSKGAITLLDTSVRPELSKMDRQLQVLDRNYMAALMEFDKNRVFYPDANFTLRVTYGQVKGYESRDAVSFEPVTTVKGIIEKDNPAIYDYDVPDRLKELYNNKDFGRYGSNGQMPVCFIGNNHTTGGNSGSPVLNAEGQLIGINFDRAWEGVASDIMYNPAQSRNISLDIRYALFLIDKYAGAGYLINEMTIIQ